jgi:hypothetical protein
MDFEEGDLVQIIVYDRFINERREELATVVPDKTGAIINKDSLQLQVHVRTVLQPELWINVRRVINLTR